MCFHTLTPYPTHPNPNHLPYKPTPNMRIYTQTYNGEIMYRMIPLLAIWGSLRKIARPGVDFFRGLREVPGPPEGGLGTSK